MLESYFTRHSVNWCCKNRNAFCVGLSLSTCRARLYACNNPICTNLQNFIKLHYIYEVLVTYGCICFLLSVYKHFE
jgi:hypothetical protein